MKSDRKVKDLALVNPGEIAVSSDGNAYEVVDAGILEWDFQESVDIYTKYDKNIKKKFGKVSDIGVIVIRDDKGKIRGFGILC